MTTKPKQFEIWMADLSSRSSSNSSKTKPVLVIQTNQLNKVHPSTLICPLTSNIQPDSQVLRVLIPRGTANVVVNFDVMIDQIRAISNQKLISKVGVLPRELAEKVKRNIKIVLDLD